MVQRPRATRVAGFNAWKDVKRSVKKGEKGIAILAPMPTRGDGADAGDGSDGAGGEGGKGPRMFFRIAHVFDIEQTEGEPLPSVTKILDGGDTDQTARAYELLRDYAERTLKVPVTIEPTTGCNGFLDRTGRRIVVGEQLPPLARTKTLAHEIAHAVLHLDAKESHERPAMEVEAESTAYVVLDALGFDSAAYSFGYVASWAEGDKDALTKAGANITRASQQILDAILDAASTEPAPAPVIADAAEIPAPLPPLEDPSVQARAAKLLGLSLAETTSMSLPELRENVRPHSAKLMTDIDALIHVEKPATEQPADHPRSSRRSKAPAKARKAAARKAG